ncbi:hypothetical protein TDB9533_04347 [Thalassocella blandensis]|nr:hypothetical protein TDB9533_04347 [Thalassocella blandensis]
MQSNMQTQAKDNDTIPDISLQKVESFLSQHNSFCLLDWLLSENIIAYHDYENWRYGKIDVLQENAGLSEKALQNTRTQMQKISQSLGLEADQQELHCWDKTQAKLLKFSSNTQIHHAVTAHWMRSQDIPQMDLFMDNTAVVVENTLHHALSARDFSEAQKLLTQLTALNAKHAKLGVYRDLILYGEYIAKVENIDAADIEAELDGLALEVTPLAKEALGMNARDFLAFAWRRLSQNLQVNYQPGGSNSKLHPAYALIQIPDWNGAYTLLLEDEALAHNKELLLYFAQCCEQLKLTNALVFAWSKLFDLDPEFAETSIESRQHPQLWHQWQDYWEKFEEAPAQYFAAYLMAKNAGIVHHKIEKLPLNSNALSAMLEALSIEIIDKDMVKARSIVQQVDPQLLGIYFGVRGK